MNTIALIISLFAKLIRISDINEKSKFSGLRIIQTQKVNVADEFARNGPGICPTSSPGKETFLTDRYMVRNLEELYAAAIFTNVAFTSCVTIHTGS